MVNSLARPDGNITGTSLLSTELDGKRLEILIEALPGLRHMAALADSNTTAAPRLRSLQDAARTRGIELSVHQIAKPEEIPDALEAAKASGAEAINVLSSPVLYGNRQIIIQRAATLRLPAIYQFPEEAEEGGLIGYGPSIIRMFRELSLLSSSSFYAVPSQPIAHGQWHDGVERLFRNDPLGEKP